MAQQIMELVATRKQRELALLASDKLVLRHLRYLAKRYGTRFYRKHGDIAAAIGVHVSTVLRSIKRLLAAGMIGTKQRFRDMPRGGKWYGASWYWVTGRDPIPTSTLSSTVPQKRSDDDLFNEKRRIKSNEGVQAEKAMQPIGATPALLRTLDRFRLGVASLNGGR